ncbi:amino acid ABC transporter substrate-binding protein (PAAT family) [Janthinobacterium sp. 61]|uniref:substrate-binding periplasmic protein n=1 Tax=Janthinobacterium sp. 61 TaxID=2035209 RepID=UPI000CAF6DF6|nr:transporter substrate-binding domain-containing protein [Janthinobacterium sp. 61]PKV43222.1 amino acid ABC transporter substrate-binding protein (PAAT family) [Janthinobacterium sp. 61]
MQRRPLLMLAGLWPLGATANARLPPLPLVYPRHQALNDPQQGYVTALLQMALARSGQAYALRRSELRMVQTRAMQEIATASGSVDVVWAMTSRARETQLLPVRIPIDRGLIGWRVALIQARQPQLLRSVRSITALARLSAGQMRDWPDSAILQANGLRLDTSSTYEGLFQQLAAGRIDYFPRSVIEVQSELASHAQLPLALDAHLVIRYPAALYFFVGKHRPELVRHIEIGLETMLADGSFAQLFQRHFGRLADGLKLSHRYVLELANPDLPEETPLARKALWYRPNHH